MSQMFPAQLKRFTQPALARRALWRIIASLLLMTAFLIGIGLGAGAIMIALGVGWDGADPLQALNSAEGALLALATFIPWWIALALALGLFHRRRLRSLFGGPIKSGIRPFAAGFAIALVLAAVTGGIAMALTGAPVRSDLSFATWAMTALIAVPLLLIQTGAEEALFRGYLLQQMAARFRSPLAWAVLPSLLFGALHWNPAAPGDTALVVAITGMTGLIFAIMTARTGGLGLAWGLHFGVNLTAILFVSPGDYFSGLALWHWPEAEVDGLVWLDFAAMGLLLAGVLCWALRPKANSDQTEQV